MATTSNVVSSTSYCYSPYVSGNTLTYTYDQADRVTNAAYTGGPSPVTVTLTYDGAGNLRTQADSSGTTTYAYDGLNLVISRTATSGGGTLSYGYDADGNLTSVQDAGGTTAYVYDTRNLLGSLTDPEGNLSEFAYNAGGQRTTTWFNTDTTESAWSAKIVTSYDLGGRISRIQATENSAAPATVSDVSYCYTKFVSGQACPTGTKASDRSLLQYSADSKTGTVSQYAYDGGNRLTKATNVGATTYAYGYDSDGNLATGAAAGTLSYNSGNQVSTAGHSYDGAGNLTADPASGALSYTDAGQLASAGNAGGNGTENFAYAGATQDQVLSDGTAAGITYGLAGQDGQPWVQSYTAHAAGGNTEPTYVLHDQQGTPLGMLRNGHAYAFVTDNLGSVTHLIDTTGATQAAYAHDPYGNQVSQSGGEALFNLLGYTGALTDPAPDQGAPSTGYTHLGNRWQNPATGSFTQQDSLSQLGNPANGNRYAYAADNPANYIDPTGQSSCSTLGWIATGLGIGALVLGVVAATVASGGTLAVAAVFGSIAFGEGSAAFGLASNFC